MFIREEGMNQQSRKLFEEVVKLGGESWRGILNETFSLADLPLIEAYLKPPEEIREYILRFPGRQAVLVPSWLRPWGLQWYAAIVSGTRVPFWWKPKGTLEFSLPAVISGIIRELTLLAVYLVKGEVVTYEDIDNIVDAVLSRLMMGGADWKTMKDPLDYQAWAEKVFHVKLPPHKSPAGAFSETLLDLMYWLAEQGTREKDQRSQDAKADKLDYFILFYTRFAVIEAARRGYQECTLEHMEAVFRALNKFFALHPGEILQMEPAPALPPLEPGYRQVYSLHRVGAFLGAVSW